MYKFLDNDYKLVKGKDNFVYDDVLYFFTEYFLPYDYILGDYSYGKLRLKGFYLSNNKSCNNHNDIKDLDRYISDYCSIGAKTFLLEKEKNMKNSKKV